MSTPVYRLSQGMRSISDASSIREPLNLAFSTVKSLNLGDALFPALVWSFHLRPQSAAEEAMRRDRRALATQQPLVSAL